MVEEGGMARWMRRMFGSVTRGGDTGFHRQAADAAAMREEIAVLRQRQESVEVALVGLRQAVELGRDRVLEDTHATRNTMRVIEGLIAEIRDRSRDSTDPRLMEATTSLERAVLTLIAENLDRAA